MGLETINSSIKPWFGSLGPVSPVAPVEPYMRVRRRCTNKNVLALFAIFKKKETILLYTHLGRPEGPGAPAGLSI